MKYLVVFSIFMIFFSVNAKADVSVIVDGRTYYCSENGQPVPNPGDWKCIPKCAARNSSGSCYQYDKDFCGYDPKCYEQCTARNSSGTCYQYGPDSCR